MSRNSIAVAALIALAPLAALTAPISAGAADSAADNARRAPAYKVIAKINKTEVVAGEDVVKIKGRVKPTHKARGQKVVLQQRLEGRTRWSKTDAAKVKKSGKFVLKDKPNRAGEREYRVVKKAAKGHKKGVSKTMTTTVWAWQQLAYLPAGYKSGVTVNSGYIATESYYPVIQSEVAGTAGAIEYTLGNKCTTLRGTYALLDSSATGSSGSVSVSADGVLRSKYDLAVGTIAADEEISVTDVFRLRFDMTSTPAPAATPAVADAEVLCR